LLLPPALSLELVFRLTLFGNASGVDKLHTRAAATVSPPDELAQFGRFSSSLALARPTTLNLGGLAGSVPIACSTRRSAAAAPACAPGRGRSGRSRSGHRASSRSASIANPASCRLVAQGYDSVETGSGSVQGYPMT